MTRPLAIIGAAAIALAAGKFGLLAVAPLAVLLFWRALDSASVAEKSLKEGVRS